MPQMAPQEIGPKCRPAASRKELEDAFKLVYQRYIERGYIEENPAKMRVTVYNAFPGATTFVCALREVIVATVTALPDTRVGLPMDEIYRDELNALRAQGRKLAEITMLADRRRSMERSVNMVCLLVKRSFDLCTLTLGLDDTVITINPRHNAYYERRLLFDSIGEPKAYPSVQNNPALGKRLDLRAMEAKCAAPENEWQRKLFFEDRTPLEVLRGGYRMTPDDLRYFFIEQTDTFRRAPGRVMACLREMRPDCPWREWGFPGESA